MVYFWTFQNATSVERLNSPAIAINAPSPAPSFRMLLRRLFALTLTHPSHE